MRKLILVGLLALSTLNANDKEICQGGIEYYNETQSVAANHQSISSQYKSDSKARFGKPSNGTNYVLSIDRDIRLPANMEYIDSKSYNIILGMTSIKNTKSALIYLEYLNIQEKNLLIRDKVISACTKYAPNLVVDNKTAISLNDINIQRKELEKAMKRISVPTYEDKLQKAEQEKQNRMNKFKETF